MSQPFYVINDEGYNNIFTALTNGERFMKSYIGTCPHKKKEDCKCPFYLNFLKDGKMVRSVNGEIKEVLSETMFRSQMTKPYKLIEIQCGNCSIKGAIHSKK